MGVCLSMFFFSKCGITLHMKSCKKKVFGYFLLKILDFFAKNKVIHDENVSSQDFLTLQQPANCPCEFKVLYELPSYHISSGHNRHFLNNA